MTDTVELDEIDDSIIGASFTIARDGVSGKDAVRSVEKLMDGFGVANQKRVRERLANWKDKVPTDDIVVTALLDGHFTSS